MSKTSKERGSSSLLPHKLLNFRSHPLKLTRERQSCSLFATLSTNTFLLPTTYQLSSGRLGSAQGSVVSARGAAWPLTWTLAVMVMALLAMKGVTSAANSGQPHAIPCLHLAP